MSVVKNCGLLRKQIDHRPVCCFLMNIRVEFLIRSVVKWGFDTFPLFTFTETGRSATHKFLTNELPISTKPVAVTPECNYCEACGVNLYNASTGSTCPCGVLPLFQIGFPRISIDFFITRQDQHLVHADKPHYLSLIHISEPTRLGMISYAV